MRVIYFPYTIFTILQKCSGEFHPTVWSTAVLTVLQSSKITYAAISGGETDTHKSREADRHGTQL
jgi:hypothetical protein